MYKKKKKNIFSILAFFKLQNYRNLDQARGGATGGDKRRQLPIWQKTFHPHLPFHIKVNISIFIDID